jgi:hypothetical protein
MFVPCRQNRRTQLQHKIASEFFEIAGEVETFVSDINRNCGHEEIKTRLNSGNAVIHFSIFCDPSCSLEHNKVTPNYDYASSLI